MTDEQTELLPPVMHHEATYSQEPRVFRYLLNGGRTMDVTTQHTTSSIERAWVLDEAKRVWGKLNGEDWKISGTVEL